MCRRVLSFIVVITCYLFGAPAWSQTEMEEAAEGASEAPSAQTALTRHLIQELPKEQSAPAAPLEDLRLQSAEAELSSLKRELQALSAALEENQARLKALENKAPETAPSSGKALLSHLDERMQFSTYGRVLPAINPANGRSAKPLNIVVPAPRLVENSFAEFSVNYTPFIFDNGTRLKIYTTIAMISANIYHYDSKWAIDYALRNLYAEASNIFVPGLSFWVGSRMYREDDIYLFNVWPLHEVSAFGGGARWQYGPGSLNLAFSGSRNRTDYQYVVEEGQSKMDRQHVIAIFYGDYQWGGESIEGSESKRASYKLKFHSEFHGIASGAYTDKDQNEVSYPSDYGWLLGLQFGLFDFMDKGLMDDSYIKLILLYSGGLAAYPVMKEPFGFNQQKRLTGAASVFASLDARLHFWPYLSARFATYYNHFVDADKGNRDRDFNHAAWNLRLTGHIYKAFELSLDLSQQLSKPSTGELASIFRLGLMPTINFGRWGAPRAELRLNYAVSFLNQAAAQRFASDPVHKNKIDHYLGLSAEWFFSTK